MSWAPGGTLSLQMTIASDTYCSSSLTCHAHSLHSYGWLHDGHDEQKLRDRCCVAQPFLLPGPSVQAVPSRDQAMATRIGRPPVLIRTPTTPEPAMEYQSTTQRSSSHRATTASEQLDPKGSHVYEEPEDTTESPMIILGRRITDGSVQAEDIERAFGHRGQIFLASTFGGLFASMAAAPGLTVIDMAVARAQFQNVRLRQALREVMRGILMPQYATRTVTPDGTACIIGGRSYFYSGMRVMTGVYAATYLTANYTKSICDEYDIDYKVPVATAASVVNVSAVAWKERVFAKLSCGTPAKVPLSSSALFALRDAMTITGSFVVKNRVRDILTDRHGLRHRTADLAACFIVPALVQVVSAPLHIVSHDLYRRPTAGPTARLAEVGASFAQVAGGRVLRIIPAYGIAGFMNDVIREAFTGVEEHDR